MPELLYFQVDQGRYSAGHSYLLSDREAKRFKGARRQLTVMRGGKQTTAIGPIAVSPEEARATPATEKAAPKKIEHLRMLFDVGKLSAGHVYGLPASLVALYCDGYETGGKWQAPVGERVTMFDPLRTKGVSPARAKALEAAGMGTAEALVKASAEDIAAVEGIGAGIAARLKTAAAEHLE